MENMNEKDILQGTDGRIWMNGEKQGQCNKFEGKANLEYEDVNLPGERQTRKRYMGWSGEGSMGGYKVDSTFIKTYAEGIKSGVLPEIKIVGKLVDATNKKSERVAFYGVKFNELTLMKFENKTNQEEEVSFTFDDYEIIDTI